MLTRIARIPCEVRVKRISEQKPSGLDPDADLDYDGQTTVEFEVFDLKGYPADWLSKKMTDADILRIERSLLAQSRP